MEASFVVVGGGIAGVSCVEGLSFLTPHEAIVLISASNLVKTVTNIIPIGRTLVQFDVEEKDISNLTGKSPSIKVINDFVAKVNRNDKTIETKQGIKIKYKKLCICTGARPKLIAQNNPHVIGIRDVESVENLSKRIQSAEKIIVVGNGGIATELIHALKGLDIVWVIKDKHVAATFVDPGAAQFFQDAMLTRAEDNLEESTRAVKRMKYTIRDGKLEQKEGPALGPDWHNNIAIGGSSPSETKLEVEYECEVTKILSSSEATSRSDQSKQYPVYVQLSNGKVIGADFIVSATGVTPNSGIAGLEDLQRGEDNGFLVDWNLTTSDQNIYAAGDIASANWKLADHWFQMRLWTQALQMGRYAAKSMYSSSVNEDFYQDFCFELFTHVTKFFGYKVVLLGLFNGQKLDDSYEILLRVTKKLEYVKIILKDGKMQGAVLIGDTDLEEMCENLILNQLDLSIYGEDLLNPDIDIEDYFD